MTRHLTLLFSERQIEEKQEIIAPKPASERFEHRFSSKRSELERCKRQLLTS